MVVFGANLGGAKQAEEAWSRISTLAYQTGNDLRATAAGFNGLLAGGFKLGEAEELMRMLGDMKAMDPTANLEGLALAIKQIKMTGKLQGDELNQLGNAVSVDAVYQELAKKLGKTKAEIIKMKEAGKITADDAIDAIKKATMARSGKPLGGLAEEAASKTLIGNLMRAKVLIDEFAGSLSIDFSPVARFLERFSKVLTGEAGKRFGSSIEGSMNGVLGILDSISEKDLEKGFDTMASTLDTAGAAARDFSDAMKTIDSLTAKVSDKTSAWGLLMNVAMMGINGAVLGVEMLLAPITGIYNLAKLIGDKIAEWAGGIQRAAESMKFFGGGAVPAGVTNAAGGGTGGDAQRGFVEDVIARFGGNAAGAPPSSGAAAEVTRTVQVNMTISAMGITTDQLTQQIAQQAKEAVQSELGKLEE